MKLFVGVAGQEERLATATYHITLDPTDRMATITESTEMGDIFIANMHTTPLGYLVEYSRKRYAFRRLAVRKLKEAFESLT